jgi:hypothetical protein
MSTTDQPRPTLKVIRGDATPEEIAALLAVVAARSAGDDGPVRRPKPTSAWTDRAALARRPVRPGPGAWRASAWPQ